MILLFGAHTQSFLNLNIHAKPNVIHILTFDRLETATII